MTDEWEKGLDLLIESFPNEGTSIYIDHSSVAELFFKLIQVTSELASVEDIASYARDRHGLDPQIAETLGNIYWAVEGAEVDVHDRWPAREKLVSSLSGAQ